MKKNTKGMPLHTVLNSRESIQNAYLYGKQVPKGSRYVKKSEWGLVQTLSVIAIVACVVLLFVQY